MGEPLHGFLHRSGGEPAHDGAARLGPRDEPGIRQHIEVLHHGGQRHGKRLREFADGQVRAGGQTCKQGASRRVGQGGECAVQGRFRILNHRVKFKR